MLTYLYSGFLIKAAASTIGIIPSIVNKIIPGNKKLLNGEFSNKDKGIPNSLPDGEMINTLPPNIAPNPRNINKIISRFLIVMISGVLRIYIKAE
jgi:hypothetical protein